MSTKRFRFIDLILIPFLALTFSGCSGGTANTYNSATATAQAVRAGEMATQMASELEATRAVEDVFTQATLQAKTALLSEAAQWPLAFSDPFDDNAHDWPVGDDTDPLANISREIDSGSYQWNAKANDAFVWWVYPDMPSFSDFYLSVSARQISGPESGEFGLIFRLTNDDSYYLYELNASQQFSLYYNDQGDWESLLDWQESPAIQAGEANQLAVIAQGPQLTLVINGQLVSEYYDTRLTSGEAGLLIGLSNPDDEGAWEFDDFELRTNLASEPSDSPTGLGTPSPATTSQ